jgi:AcrR family transcriptional regulator
MARNTEKDQQLREERTEQILDAALRVFAKQGILTKVSDIAAAAGVSHGHVYNYFASKEDILIQLVTQGQQLYERTLIQVQHTPVSALEKLRDLVGRFIPSERKADIYLVLLQAQATDLLPEDVKERINEQARSNLNIVAQIIADGQKEGEIKAGSPKLLATLLVTLMQNLSLLTLRGFEPITEQELDSVLDLVRRTN